MNGAAPVYPAQGRSAWVAAQRPPRGAAPDPERPHGVFLEEERLATGEVAASGAVLLTNRECPWRCVMCDLWRDMLPGPAPAGAVARQVEAAVRGWREAGTLPAQVKLYNSGSFFDAAAIPEAEYAPIAQAVAFARRVVVESHPLLVGDKTRRLRDRLAGALEVAVGLETAEPAVLEKLNKGFDLGDFARAAELLAAERIALRAFVLVQPPFLPAGAGAESAVRTAAHAFDRGATAVVLIPTRGGNGAMERLRASGEFTPPTLAELEAAQRGALALGRGRVFADTWAIEPFARCAACLPARRARLERINRTQRDEAPIACPACGGA